MADLREIMEGLGAAEVRTHLQSGNVVFAPAAAAGAGPVGASGFGEGGDDAVGAGVVGASGSGGVGDDAVGEGVVGASGSGGVGDAAAEWTDRIAKEIERAIERRLGLDVPVLVRGAGELAEVVERNPLREIASNPSRLLVTFLSSAVRHEQIADIDPDRFLPDRFAAGEREIYVWAPRGASETKLTHSFWEKRLGVRATARNWNTVQRLLEIATG